MARTSWLDDKASLPIIDEQVEKLKHFVDSLADGVVDDKELRQQQDALVAAMKAAEADLNDAQHAKVTRLLVELSAYNVMKTLHEMMTQRVRTAFGKS